MSAIPRKALPPLLLRQVFQRQRQQQQQRLGCGLGRVGGSRKSPISPLPRRQVFQQQYNGWGVGWAVSYPSPTPLPPHNTPSPPQRTLQGFTYMVYTKQLLASSVNRLCQSRRAISPRSASRAVRLFSIISITRASVVTITSAQNCFQPLMALLAPAAAKAKEGLFMKWLYPAWARSAQCNVERILVRCQHPTLARSAQCNVERILVRCQHPACARSAQCNVM